MLDLMVIILGNIFVFEYQSISLNLINRVCFHTREDAYVLSVMYERLPNFCYFCGSFEHLIRDCAALNLLKLRKAEHYH